MNEDKYIKRTTLHRTAAFLSILPIIINVILIALFNNGLIGRCDGIWLVGSSFIVSIGLLIAALAITGWMLFNREKEPLWALILLAIIQVICLVVLVVPFVRH